MSNGKGGNQQKQYDQFGTVAGLVGPGPFHQLRALVVGGKALWEGTITRGEETFVDLTSLIDGANFMPGGYLHFYWGTPEQTADPYLATQGHDAYKGYAYVVARNFLFGPEVFVPRDMKVVASSLPQVPVGIVAAIDNVMDDGQVNPVAGIAEVLLLLGVAEERFNGASWRAAAHDCAATAAMRLLTFCSPQVKTFEDAHAVIGDLLAMCDGALRRNTAGEIEFVLLRWGTPPGTVPFFDARHYLDGSEPDFEGPGLDEVPTRFEVGFIDRAKQYKEASETTPNPWAVQMRQGDVDRMELPRLAVMRREQAAVIGQQAVRHTDQPRAQGTVALRSFDLAMRAAGGDPLLPGDKAYFDIDPTPGGEAQAQLCVIEERVDKLSGDVVLTVRADTLSPVIPYTPNWIAAEPQDAIADPVEHAVVIPLPPAAFGQPIAVAVLATRPERNTVGMRVFFDTDEEGDFPELGLQTGFAVRAALVAGVDAAATVLQLQLLDGATGADAYLAERTPESEVAARADVLLAILANVDVDGRVVVDVDGKPEMEFCSIVGRAAVSADTHDYTLLRARRGLAARDWADTAQVWIVPLDNLKPWRHPDMIGLLSSGAVGRIRLSAYTTFAEDDTPEIPEFTFVFPSLFDIAPRIDWTSPSGSSAETDAAGDITISGEVTDRQGDLSSLRIDSRREDGSAETTHLDQGFPATALRAFSHALNFAGHASEYRIYILRIEARDQQSNLAIQSRMIVRPPTGTPATPPPPTFDPASDTSFAFTANIYVRAVSPATQIHWRVEPIGSTTPGAFSTYAGLEVEINLWNSGRIWARASDGIDHSPWVYADFYKQGSGGSWIEP